MSRLGRLIEAEASSYEGTTWKGTLGGEEVTLHARPLTGADMSYITRKHPEFMLKPSMDGMVDLIIRKATDEAGDRAFTVADRVAMTRLTVEKIGEIFGGLFGDQMVEDADEDHEARVKN